MFGSMGLNQRFPDTGPKTFGLMDLNQTLQDMGRKTCSLMAYWFKPECPDMGPKTSV